MGINMLTRLYTHQIKGMGATISLKQKSLGYKTPVEKVRDW